MSTAFRSLGLLDVLSSTPAGPSVALAGKRQMRLVSMPVYAASLRNPVRTAAARSAVKDLTVCGGMSMSKPGYVKFALEGANYVYDSHTNGIVGIDPSVQEILDDYFRFDRHELEQAHPDLSESVLNRSVEFIEDAIRDVSLFRPLSPVEFLRALKPDEFHAALRDELSEFSLNATDQCNQFCTYCHLTYSRLSQPKKAFRSMTWDVARNSLDRFLEVTSTQRTVDIGFYGGEPLLNWELIQKCLRYIRESHAGRKIRIRLVSNATLLNKGILKTLIDADAHLQVSLDGPKHIHDASRSYGDGRGTYQRVYDWLAEIRAINEDYFHNNIFIHCTFSKQNDILEVFRYFSEGVFAESHTTIGHVASSFPGRFSFSPEQMARHEERIEQLIEMYLAALRTNAEFNFDLFWDILKDPLSFAQRTPGWAPESNWPNGICVPGVRRLFVASNGKFYPCEKFCPEGWDIGSHRTGIEFSKAQALFQIYANLCQETCQGCWAYRLCSLCYLSIIAQDRVDTLAKAEKCNRERARIVTGLRRFVYIWGKEPREAYDHPFSLHYSAGSGKSS